MKDIKSLYLTAKSSGKKADITAYTESIQDLIDNDPNSYITQLEYIISSDIGLKTIKPFIEKNGFPIACYDNIIECLNECIRKCEVYKKDDTPYREMVEYFESFRKDHINCFMMFENYKSDIKANYVKTYYSKNNKGIQNRKLAAGMIKHFGEAAIPDTLITAESINEDAVHKILEFINDVFYTNENCATIYEWVLTACKDIKYGESSEDVINHMEENCLSSIVDKIKAREYQLYRESLILDRDDLVMEYSNDDLMAIQNLISFKEYQMTWADEITEKAVVDIQKEIYDLYEMADGIEPAEPLPDENVTNDAIEEFVPIYGIVASYTNSDTRNDNITQKSDKEIRYSNIGKVMNFMTNGDNYSHALISLDDSFTKMYSYDGNNGFVTDNINDNDLWITTDSIYICVMFISKSDKDRIEKYLNNLYNNHDETKYAYENLLKIAFNKTTKVDKRFVCSSFVGYVMAYANPKNLHRDYSRIRPEDITILPRSFYVMNVKDRNDFIKNHDEIVNKVDKIYHDYYDEICDYNNHLPKLMLKDRCDELKTIDKILNWAFNRLG